MKGSAVQIKSLRVRGTGRYAPEIATRRLEFLLSAANWGDTGLAPANILCIRKLHDPLPYVLPLDGRAVLPPQRWQLALTGDLARLVREAARPARGSVQVNAEAVVFDDWAQVLACFAGDFIEGGIGGNWWWDLLMSQRALLQPLGAVVQHWLAEPYLLPGTLASLEHGTRLRFVGLLGNNVAGELLHAMSRCLGLPVWKELIGQNRVRSAIERPDVTGTGTAAMSVGDNLPARFRVEFWDPEDAGAALPRASNTDRVPRVAPPNASTATRRRTPESAESENGRSSDSSDESMAEPSGVGMESLLEDGTNPWQGVLSDADGAVLAPWAEALLGVALCAARAPVRLCDPAWIEGVCRRLTHRLGPAAAAAADSASNERPSVGRVGSSVGERQDPNLSPVSQVTTSVRPLDNERAEGLRAWIVPSQSLDAPIQEMVADRQVQTALAGLFYLLNVALYLGLYGDFTRPLDRGLPLPIWDFVVLVGRALLGSDYSPEDPLWVLLADLAGRRSDSKAGAGFVPPPDWRLPSAWLAALPHEPHQVALWSLQQQRLVAVHPLGFVVLDLPAIDDAAACALAAEYANELEGYGLQLAKTERIDCVMLRNEPSLDRWVLWISEYIRCRLHAVLSLDPDQRLGSVVFAQPGFVVVTPAHVDVLFSLEKLPISIRLAGLDRDPGFVPSAGRSIRFFFQ